MFQFHRFGVSDIGTVDLRTVSTAQVADVNAFDVADQDAVLATDVGRWKHDVAICAAADDESLVIHRYCFTTLLAVAMNQFVTNQKSTSSKGVE